MPSLSHILRATVLAAAAIPTSACSSGGESCHPTPACKYVDLLAACTAASGCVEAGDVQIVAPADPQASTVVQTALDNSTVALLGTSSTLGVPVPSDAATRAALPLLEITLDPVAASTITIDGQPASCAPVSTASGAGLRCTLPAGAKSVSIQSTGDKLTVTSMVLTEATCTGTTEVCAL